MPDDPSSPSDRPDAAPPGAGVHDVTDSIASMMFAAARPASSASWEPPSHEELQRSFPQYEIRGILGRGGMGAVYRGWQNSLDRGVAIKVLPPGIDDGGMNFAERFKQEARAMARFKHPGIVAVYDAGETPGGMLYFVMECIEGTDVDQLVASHGRVPPTHALGIISRVCEALAYAHERGVIHRDIKPSNVMIEADGTVKIADFGLAKLSSAEPGTHTLTNVAIGTPDFMAPEALHKTAVVDHRADLYAAGVMLYQMLTGTIPRGRFSPPSELVEGLDPRVDAIVDKALQPDREKRYSTADEMRADVDGILNVAAVQSEALPIVDGPPPAVLASPARRKMPLWIAAAAILGLAVGGAWWSRAGGGRRAEKPPAITAGDPVQSGKTGAATVAPEEIRRRWRPVPSQLAAQVDRGTVHLQHFNTWGGTRFRMGNVAVRALIAWQPSPPGRNDLIKVVARWTDTEHYYATLYGPVVELGYYRAPGLTALQRWTVEPPPAPDEAISLQLACVGHRLAVWVRGRLVGTFDDDVLAEPANVGVQAIDGHIQSLEYLDLDGLPEVEALALVGLKKE